MEYWDIYDADKQLTGRIMKREDWNMKPGEYHLTVLGVIRRPNQTFLITQRVLTKSWAPGWWEVSGGGVQAGETSQEAVRRELLEETGYESDDWTYLGQTLDSTSKLSARVHLFLAKNCEKTGRQHLDANEHLTVTEICLERAVDMVMNGTICANSTAHLILKTARIMNL